MALRGRRSSAQWAGGPETALACHCCDFCGLQCCSLRRSLGLLPQAVLSAIVIIYSVSLIPPAGCASASARRGEWNFTGHWRHFISIARVRYASGHRRHDVVLSLISLASRVGETESSSSAASPGTDVLRPLTSGHPDDETFDGLLILRPEGQFCFSPASSKSRIQFRHSVAEYKPKVLALDMSGSLTSVLPLSRR